MQDGSTSASLLFQPYRLRDLALANRIVVAPMCQYSADEGCANDWHMMHLGALSNSGAALLIVEATAVEPAGRIGHGCLGLYSDENEHALARVVDACRRLGTARIGIQLAHAGRKAASMRPWEGKTMHDPLHENSWPTRSASAVPFGEGWHTPTPMTLEDISALREMFGQAVTRCDRIGFDMIELHAAHGYLLHQFLSPYANERTDIYGGSLENRMRIVLEVFETMRAAWPAEKPMGVRLSCVDWVEGQWSIEDTVTLSARLKALGCDYIDCSSGGIDPNIKVPTGPGYQVPFAAQVRKEVEIPTMAVGMITDPHQAEAILQEGHADLIAIARGFLDDPHWAWHAAYALGAEVALPPQYQRAGLRLWNPAKRHRAASATSSR